MFTAFPSLEQFSSVFKRETYKTPGTITYGAKVKLHGTNAGIRIMPNGSVFAQSNKKELTLEKDNGEFAAWVETQKPLGQKPQSVNKSSSSENGQDQALIKAMQSNSQINDASISSPLV
jgi:hypothetical protein